MNEYTRFIEAAEKKACDLKHRGVLEKTTGNHRRKVEGALANHVIDWQRNRELAAQVKSYVLDNLPDLLERFEEKAISNGFDVHWAAHVEDVHDVIGEVLKKHAVKKVVKSKSMTTEEVELNAFLEGHDVEVFETDLGELIVQFRNEKPYHILTPAMHLNKADVAKLFHERLGTPLDADATELTMAARKYLRNEFLSADLGVTGANFLLAEEGGVVLVENEGNGRLSMACPPIQVIIVGIEKLLPSSKELPFFLPHLVTSATGQLLNTYTSITMGPKRGDEPDGPDEVHLILLDNGRSALMRRPDLRQALRCIRCGACLNACPVYKTIGGHAYEATYPGPIGSVITPHYDGFQRYQHLPHASTLCGACSETCPVKIPLHDLIHENRVIADETKTNDASWRLVLRAWAFMASSRKRMDLAATANRHTIKIRDRFLPEELVDRIPPCPKKSFGQLWRDRER